MLGLIRRLARGQCNVVCNPYFVVICACPVKAGVYDSLYRIERVQNPFALVQLLLRLVVFSKL